MIQLVGQTLDRYRVTSFLGEGGMGAVYRAHDITLQRDVALKVMHSRFAQQPDFQERFLQEARTIARLDYPGIVKVFDFGEAHELLYLVMEFIPGDNLRQMLHDLRTSQQWIVLPESIRLIRQVSLALDYAHHQKVLHRDIKPDNIMLKDTPGDGLPYSPVLTDLGLAKLLEGGLTTEAGMAVGTPAYMSPEQAWGRTTDTRSDVYSLGILLYELSVGQLPFPVNSIGEAKHYHLREVPPAPRSINPDFPESLERIILKALEKNPASRFSQASVLAEALSETLSEASQAPTPESTVSLMTQYQHSLVKARRSSLWVEFPEIPSDLDQDRISILAPDGTVSTVPLPSRGLTIGRKADNDLVLNYPNVSKNHAQVEFDGTDYHVIDLGSTNGTFLGNAKLLPGVRKVWTPDKALRIGRSWLRLERSPSPAGSAFIPSTGTLIDPTRIDTSPGLGWVGVYVAAFQMAVTPGGETTVPVIVLNQGPETDRFEISVLGDAANWASISPSVIQLPSGTEREVTLTFRPPRSLQSRAGRHGLKIQVISQNDPSQVAEVARTLIVAAYSQFESNLHPPTIDAGQTTRIGVENQGNAQETFDLEWHSQANDLVFKTPQKQLQVHPGQAASVEFQAAPRQRPLIGGARAHLFSVQVSSSDGETQTHDGKVVSAGLVPAWFLPLFLFLCVALVAVGTFGYWAIFNSQQPNATIIAQTAAIQTPDLIATGTAAAQATIQTATATHADTDRDGTPPAPSTSLTNTLVLSTDPPAPILPANTPTPTNTSTPPTTTPEPPADTPIPPTNTPIPPTSTPVIAPGPTSTWTPTSTPTGTPTPTNTPTNTPSPTPEGRIAFQSNRDGNWNIYMMNADGSAQTRLTNNPADDQAPAWSPDGSRITFYSNRDGNSEIYVMNADGSAQTRLTNNPADDRAPAWSPDGSRIAFASNRDGNWNIYMMNADGSPQTRLTNNQAEDRGPAWSPDGSRVAFRSNRDGNWEIYVMNADGSGQKTRLTNNPADDQGMDWSPDGSRIAFTSNRDGNWEIYVMDAAGTGQINLTNNPAADRGPPAWDGSRIAFISNRDGNWEVYVMNAGGSGQMNLTNNQAEDRGPTWLP